MTKTRHRTFEIFDSVEEAKSALASKSALPKANTDDLSSWSLRHLVASHSAGIIHVRFMKTGFARPDTLRELRDDLSELAGTLVNGSQVLLDLEGLVEFDAECIAELGKFNQKLRAKGSRFVLCNLNQAVQASFFPG